MAYVLNAVIAKLEALQSVGIFSVVPVADGLCLAPLTDAFWRRHGHVSQPLRREWEARTAPETDFEKSGDRERSMEEARSAFSWIATICAAASAVAPVAYVEADFFGGGGTEAAAVWAAHEEAMVPVVGEQAINAALRKIGVQGGSKDEFDTLGLGRHRFTWDWEELALTTLMTQTPDGSR